MQAFSDPRVDLTTVARCTIVLMAAALGACGQRPPSTAGVPAPRVDIPVRAEAPAPTSSHVPNAPGSAVVSHTATCVDRFPGPGAWWVEERRWHRKTTTAPGCAVAASDASSETIARDTVIARDERGVVLLSLHVVSDTPSDARSDAAQATASLTGKSYRVERTPAGLDVRDDGGRPLTSVETRRIRALATADIGWPAWPGEDVVKALPATGDVVPSLEEAVRAMFVGTDDGAAGDEHDVRVSVRYGGVRDEGWGPAVVFDVTLEAESAPGEACGRRRAREAMTGELLLRTGDGALVGVHLRGARHVDVSPCKTPSGPASQVSAPAQAGCGDGTVAFQVLQGCMASP